MSGRCCWGCIAGLMLGQGRSLPDWQLIRLAKEMCVGSWVDRVVQQVVIACSSWVFGRRQERHLLLTGLCSTWELAVGEWYPRWRMDLQPSTGQ